MKEEWKIINDFPMYSVSNFGKIKDNETDLILEGWFSSGYRYVTLHPGSFSYKVSFIVMHFFVGPRPNGLEIHHKDGIKSNDRIDNLKYVTRSENQKHAWSSGLINREKHKKSVNYALRIGLLNRKGSRNGNSKLTELEVRRLKNINAKKWYTQFELAEIFGCSQQTISAIINGTRWCSI